MKTSEHQLVLVELARAGVKVQNIWDLVNTPFTPPSALPVLVSLLPRVTDIKIKEGIVRALSVKEASGLAAPILIEELRKLDCGDRRQEFLAWAVSNALLTMANKDMADDLLELVQDPRLGLARQPLAEALGKLKDKRAVPILVELLSDEQLTGHAIHALGNLKDKSTYSTLRQYLDHPKAWVRKETKRALDKIGHS